MRVFILLTYCVCFMLVCGYCDCKTNDNCVTFNFNEIRLKLGTKTPYRYVANENMTKMYYPHCNPERIWMIIRHGTRNPGKKLIKAMKERLTNIRNDIVQLHDFKKGTLCDVEAQALRVWVPASNLDSQVKWLTHEGEEEMLLLGERMQNRLPDLLTEHYDKDTYDFRYTATQRTEASAKYFAMGMFGRHISQNIRYPPPLYKDPILRFYKDCPRWRQEVDKNPEANKERRSFELGAEMKNVRKQVAERLGVEAEYITVDDITEMYATCAFETSWDKRQYSPWCAVFNAESIQVIEYAEDLEYYWIDGYGFPLTYKQACITIGDMFDHLSGNSTMPAATFYFTHSGTLLKLLAHLGLYKDKAAIMHKRNANREWRVSKIDAFGTNLAFIKFNCDGEENILVLHQERPVKIPGCPKKSDLCPLKALKTIFTDSIHKCDFKATCSLPVIPST